MINSRKLDDDTRYETSLMVSTVNLEYIKKNKYKYGSYSKFLSFLVFKNIKFLNIKPDIGGKVLTEYQIKGLNLKKLNFMPKSRDWLVLRLVAAHYGISISLLFALLIKKLLDGGSKTEEEKIVHVLDFYINKKLIFNNFVLDKYLQFSKIKI